MFVLAAFSAVVVVVAVYTTMSAWIYRKPWSLLVSGLVSSAFAVALKASVLHFKSLGKLPWSTEELDIAASVVDPTLVGMAGGLIASAFLIKLQILHAQELSKARRDVTRATEMVAHVKQSGEDLEMVAASLPEEEYRDLRRRIDAAKVQAVLHQVAAQTKLEKLSVPGLE